MPPPGTTPPDAGTRATDGATPAVSASRADRVEVLIARTLSIGALVAVALLLIGIALMAAAGTSPDSATYPVFDPAQVLGDLVALRPEGFLWAGVLVVIATPIVRVIGELVGFGLRRDRVMALVAAATLVVIAVSVVSALAAEA